MGGQPNPGEIDPLVRQLRNERVARLMPQWEIAERCGTTQSAVSESERGVTQPALTTLRRWADALGFDVVLQRREES